MIDGYQHCNLLSINAQEGDCPLVGYALISLGGSDSGDDSGSSSTGSGDDSGPSDTGLGGDAKTSSSKHEVLYTVEGTGSAVLTFETADGEMGQETVSLPWWLGFERFGDKFVYVAAEGSGRIECTIMVDGMVVELKTGNGKAKCEGRTE